MHCVNVVADSLAAIPSIQHRPLDTAASVPSGLHRIAESLQTRREMLEHGIAPKPTNCRRVNLRSSAGDHLDDPTYPIWRPDSRRVVDPLRVGRRLSFRAHPFPRLRRLPIPGPYYPAAAPGAREPSTAQMGAP